MLAQHEAIMAAMQNKPFHSPVNALDVKVAVDIGCGTGVMTLLMAEYFPNATIYGVDLSPVPATAQEEAKRLGGRVQFIEGNMFNLVDKHPALGSGTADFVYHRLLVAAQKSYLEYLRNVVMPLLRPGGWVEMHDTPALRWYQDDLRTPGSAKKISNDWLWIKPWNEGAAPRLGVQDTFLSIVSSLQLLDFEDATQKIYKLYWAPVKDRPETNKWAAYAPRRVADAFSVSIPKALTGAELQSVGAENLERSIRETVGKPKEGMYWPMIAAWARKPS